MGSDRGVEVSGQVVPNYWSYIRYDLDDDGNIIKVIDVVDEGGDEL